MKNLNDYNVVELDFHEQQEIDGGFVFLLGIAAGIVIGSLGCVGGYYIAKCCF